MFSRRAQLLGAVLLFSAAPGAPATGVALDVPYVSQEKNGCGAASIAMVMRYWQRQQGRPEEASAAEIQRSLYSPHARGIPASAMERYLREHGFRTFAIKGEWRDLRDHLEKGRPLIVALRTGPGDLHYVVVVGIDPQADLLVKHDPAVRASLKQHRVEFEKEWKPTGNWTLLAVPVQEH